jgi:xyloglucan-specific exo-beta-1,4-glucanase
MKQSNQIRWGVLCALFLFAILAPLSAEEAVKSEAYTWKNVRIVGGGFVPGIVFNSAEKDLIYARTDIGGAYRWNPADSSWIPLMDWVSFDEWNMLGVESLATDPVEPNRVYVASGTYTNDWTKMNGIILSSTDKGNTWKRSELPFKLGGNMPGRSMGERLAIDPNMNSVLYLGTRGGNGLWKSTDFGATWAKVKGFTAAGNYIDPYFKDQIGVVWVTFAPKTGKPGSPTKTIFVGVADTKTSIYMSTDAGETWKEVPDQPKNGFLPHHGVLASNGALYISYSNQCGPYDGDKGDVWKLNTASGEWKKISPVPSTNIKDDYFGYGGLSVDAKNPNVVMVASLNSWWPDCMIYRSTNGGESWTNAWSWKEYPMRNLKYKIDISASPWLDWGTKKAPPETSPKLGWMTGCLVIDPFNSDRMMYGTGATIYGTENLTNWDKSGGTVDIKVMAHGIEEVSVSKLISPASGVPLISALGDICGFRHEDLAMAPKSMFTKPTFGSTGSMDFAELKPDAYVRVGWIDKTYVKEQCIGISEDGTKSWKPGKDIAGFDSKGSMGGGSVAIASDASTIVWSPAFDKTVTSFSTDNAKTWTACNGIPARAKVASDRVNPKKFYGFAGGKFYVSTDGGADFAESKAALPATGTGNFKAVAGIEGDIWFAGGSEDEGVWGLFHSKDSGATFAKIEGVDEADSIGFGKAAPGKTYQALYANAKVKGVRGIFRSDDGGATWVRINDDMHQYGAANADITGDPKLFGRVYLATNGRGIPYGDPIK